MKLSNHVIQCANPNCRKLITIFSQDLAILEVTLTDVTQTWEYCSKRCAEKMLNNLNNDSMPFEEVVVENQKIISERNPFKMHIDLRLRVLKVETV